MSKLFLTVCLFMVTLAVQAQCLECAPDSFPSEQEMVKWQKKCAKKVFAPLSKSAARNPNGSLEYQEYTFSESGMKMRTVELNYISKMQSVPGMVYASMRVDGDTTYYFSLDSMYVFDHGSRLLSVQSFLDLQWDYFVENTFLSFYVYSRFVPSGSAGHKLRCYANNSSAMLVDFTAPVLSGRRDGLRDPYHPGRHNYVLDKKENHLIQYTYEPAPEEAVRLGYTQKSYHLLRKTPVYELAVPDVIKQRFSNLTFELQYDVINTSFGYVCMGMKKAEKRLTVYREMLDYQYKHGWISAEEYNHNLQIAVQQFNLRYNRNYPYDRMYPNGN